MMTSAQAVEKPVYVMVNILSGIRSWAITAHNIICYSWAQTIYRVSKPFKSHDMIKIFPSQ